MVPQKKACTWSSRETLLKVKTSDTRLAARPSAMELQTCAEGGSDHLLGRFHKSKRKVFDVLQRESSRFVYTAAEHHLKAAGSRDGVAPWSQAAAGPTMENNGTFRLRRQTSGTRASPSAGAPGKLRRCSSCCSCWLEGRLMGFDLN